MGVHITREELEKILKSKIEPIERSLKFTSEEYHAILDRVAKLEEANKSLLLENRALKSQLNSVVGKINENTALLDEQEQYIRRECVEIKGIPARRDEVTNDIVLQVAELLDVEMCEDDISNGATDYLWRNPGRIETESNNHHRLPALLRSLSGGM